MGSPRATTSAHTLDDDELPEHIDHLLILYATETGNSQDVAERLGRDVRRKGGRCVLMSMDTFDVVSPVACLGRVPRWCGTSLVIHMTRWVLTGAV